MTRYAIDPITRIEGHLRIEVEASAGRVTDAWSTGTMFRGIEKIMAGRDPLETWAFAQRACGVCTHVHAIASIRAVESALGVTIPSNARILRNIMSATQTVHDHVIHFYHLHVLDWVDVTACLTADPAATAALAAKTNVGWANNSTAYFTTVKSKLSRLVSSGQLGPFASGYWGHPAYTLPADASLLLIAHYLEALEFQREIVKIHAHIGGKNPHPQTYAVGGMATTFGPTMKTGVNTTSLAAMRSIASQATAFVEKVLLPDMALLAKHYAPVWKTVGVGIGSLLAYGDLPTSDAPGTASYLQPSGRVVGRDLTRVLPVDQARIAETVARSWYTYSNGDQSLLHPYVGQTTPAYSGPKPPFGAITTPKYSWLKAPRYEGKAYEVGPLARVMVAYASGRPDVRAAVDQFVAAAGMTTPQMFSTIGRLAARALETRILVRQLDPWLAQLQAAQAAGNLQVANPLPGRTSWPASAQGWGTTEAPRGALGHWVSIKAGKVANYQMVVPSTWNGSPRDASGARGGWETALVGNPLVDPTRPVELLRTVHSFDPCMGCAVHVLDPDGGAAVSIVQVV